MHFSGSMYNKKVILGISVLLAFYILYMFVPKSSTTILMPPTVKYVDSRTGKVLSDFDVQKVLELKVNGNGNEKEIEAESESESEMEKEMEKGKKLIQAGSSRRPIKDAIEEKKAGMQQINGGTNKKVGSKSGDKKVPGRRAKATFVSLARNSEVWELLSAIRNVEDRFNRKFNYDWVFLNDEPFTEEFKRLTSSIVSGTAKYGQIPVDHWSYPAWVDQEKASKVRKEMADVGIIYAESESYRHMCRFESGFFFRHSLMQEYDWYWRVEPGIKIHCDLNYDLFTYMEDHDKVYGFTISIYEFEKTIPTLWGHTKDFIELHPEHVAKDNFMDFISENQGDTYNLCHFWSNFEVASLKFWRSQAYTDYFEYLDKQGGFFYERWGDAPVHSIAASLFLPRSAIHFFSDVGYTHGVYTQCPLNEQFRLDNKCDCKPDSDFTFRGYSCGNRYHDVMGLEKPKEWVDYQ